MTSKNFNDIKRKYLIAAIVAAVALGVCCGVGLTCVLAVVLKRCAVDLLWAIYIPVALALAAGFFGLFYVIFKPTDAKIAKKLDRDFALGQKVQTMVEYQGEGGAMVLLQREQTDEVLGEVAKKRIDLKWLLKFLFIPVLAVAMLFAGIFVPAVKSSSDPVIPVTSNQQTSLKNLIREVRESDLDDGIKEPAVETLNGLLEGLQNSQPKSVMRRAVISSVKMIDALVAGANSYVALNSALSYSPELKDLADTLIRGTLYYSDGRALTSYSAVKENALAADEKIAAETNSWKYKFLKAYEIRSEDGEVTGYISIAEASLKLEIFAETLSERLAETSYAQVGEGENAVKDALYTSLDGLASSLKTLSGNTVGMGGDKAYYDRISNYCTAFGESGKNAMITQSYRCMMDEYIRISLARIFSNILSLSDFGQSVAIVAVIPEDDDGDKDPNNTNLGSTNGDILYGSNDLVLDVETGQQVTYGKLLSKYTAAVEDMIARGECSDEVAAYIRQYFQILFRGSESPDDNG